MRIRATIGYCIIAAIVTASCVSEDKPPVHLTIDYQLRCIPSDMCYNLPDETSHDLNGIDGLDGYTLDCEIGDEPNQFSFLVSYFGEAQGNPSGYFTVDGTGSECTLEIREGNSTFTKECEINEGGTANCTGVSVKADQPCQIAIEVNGKDATGTVCCRSIASGFGATKAKDGDLSLVKPKTYDRPATFEMEHCR